MALEKRELAELYPSMDSYTSPVKKPERPIIGREKEMRQVLAAMMRPELCNVILLAEAGTGKTALVQGTMQKDTARTYLEIDLSRMIANVSDPNEMASRLKDLFSEVAKFVAREKREVVLFMDEFHQIVQLSEAAVEAMKPLLADSGTRGIRIIAATTYEEFRKWVSPNQPLVERLQRINLAPPGEEMTIQILRNMAERYGVSGTFYNDNLFHLIYEYTNRYIPASNQPRKSIRMLDAMIGWNRAENRRLDSRLLADVIYESEGVNVAFRVDAGGIEKELNRHVFAQEYATQVIAQRLQVCVADLNNNEKPMSSFLFTGSTGVGKTEVTKQLAKILFDDARNLHRFDMTEFANPDSLNRFRSELTARVWERPYSIILFDEVEKACAEVTRVLLQVLDDGRLTDDNNREVSFLNAYIVMTTNAGSEIYKTISQYRSSDQGSFDIAKEYNKLIRRSISETTGDNRFPPELLGRIDCIVPFQPLSLQTMRRIAENKLKGLMRTVREKHNTELSIAPRVVTYLVDENLDTQSDSGGARVIVSKLESEVTVKVAAFINNNPDVSRIRVDVMGEMACENTSKRVSDATISVKAMI